MTKTNKVISADVKAQILDRVKEGVSISQIAAEHGISNRTIYGWLSKGVATAQPSWVEYNKLKRENQALKELIGHITYEKTMAQKKELVMDKITKTAKAKSLGISRSSLYYKHKQFKKDWALKILIEQTLHDKPSYGHKRLSGHLKINKKRILRVMNLFGIKPYRRRGRKFKKSRDNGCIYQNLLLITMPQYPGHIWASDFTHISYKGRTIYLATVIDIFTREVVGFSIMFSHSVNIVINALLMSLTNQSRPEIIHSDQGSEYKSRTYTSLVESLNIKISMSRKASPWENGYQESFYNQFKVDLADPNRFDSLGELIAEIYQVIHSYNNYRIHSKLKMAPRQYLNRLANKGSLLTEKVS